MTQMPLFEPESDWVAPDQLPDMQRCNEIAFDIETCDRGLQAGIGPGWPFKAGFIDGVSYATDRHRGYVPLRGSGAFDQSQVVQWLTDHFASTPAIFHNAPYDLGWLNAIGVPFPKKLHDTMLMSVMLDEERKSYSLDNLCDGEGIEGKDERLLEEAAMAFGLQGQKANGRFKDRITQRQIKEGMWQLPNRYKGPYAEQDAQATLDLFRIYEPLIGKQGLNYPYSLEVDLIPVTIEMRKRGIRIDLDKAERGVTEMQADITRQLATMSDQCGTRGLEVHDLRSPKMLMSLFDAQGVKYPMTENSGMGSFSKDWMQIHDHWLPQAVTAVRALADASDKFMDTYIKKYTSNGRIHAEIHLFKSDRGGTKTHRMAYSNPPLQQMPSRDEATRKYIRGVFLPEEGTDWLVADYSQQEPRLTVHYAIKQPARGWKDALDFYTTGSADYHDMVAHLTGLERKKAKVINLGLAYGMGLKLMAKHLGLSIADTEPLMALYHERVPFVRDLSGMCSRVAASRGYIKLIDGAMSRFNRWERKYPPADAGWQTYGYDDIRQLFPSEPIKRAFTRNAMNRLIQGSAARQTKKAMLDCYRAGFLPMLQLHDDLNFSITDVSQAHQIRDLMSDAIPLEVPMKVDLEIGPNWADVKEI